MEFEPSPASSYFSYLFLCAVCAFSVAQSCSTLCSPWAIASQAPLSMAFSKQDFWNGVPFSPPGTLPNPGIKPASLASPALTGKFFTASTTWEALPLCHSTSN